MSKNSCASLLSPIPPQACAEVSYFINISNYFPFPRIYWMFSFISDLGIGTHYLDKNVSTMFFIVLLLRNACFITNKIEN